MDKWYSYQQLSHSCEGFRVWLARLANPVNIGRSLMNSVPIATMARLAQNQSFVRPTNRAPADPGIIRQVSRQKHTQGEKMPTG